MPQLTLEYSANVREKENLIFLLKKYNSMLTQMLPTTLASCKSRAVERSSFCIGDGDPKNGFVHISLKVMPGRTSEKLKEVGISMLEILKEYFSISLKELTLELTIEIAELPNTYFKYRE